MVRDSLPDNSCVKIIVFQKCEGVMIELMLIVNIHFHLFSCPMIVSELEKSTKAV